MWSQDRLLTIFPVLHWMGQGHRVSLLPAINLSQLSEFSLVILALGFKAGHLNKQTKGIAAYGFVILAILSSYAMLRSDSLLRRISPWLNKIRLRDLNQRTDHMAEPKGGRGSSCWDSPGLPVHCWRKSPGTRRTC